MSNFFIQTPGWYLLSGRKDYKLIDLIDEFYPKYAYLDISAAYIPLYKGITEADISLGTAPNNITYIDASNIDFNKTVGEIAPNSDFSLDQIGIIKNLDISFSENVGVWVLMEVIDIFPTLHLEIENPRYGIDDYPTIINHPDDLNIIYDLSDNDTIINFSIERTFPFNINMITHSLSNNAPNNFFNPTALNPPPDPPSNSTITYDGSFNYTTPNVVNGKLDLSMNTDTSGNSATITYKIVTSGSTDISFSVIINLLVVDTIYPTIQFHNEAREQGVTVNYVIEKYHFRGNLQESNFNNTISLNQSYIKTYPNINLLPKVTAYDQNQEIINNVNLTIFFTNSSIVDPNTLYIDGSPTEYQRKYAHDTWWPGTYKLYYRAYDYHNKTTTVDVSFIIVDDISPTLKITENSGNIISSYTIHNTNNDYQSDNINNGDISNGIGFSLSNEFTSFEFTKTASQSNPGNQNIYLYFSDVSSTDAWSFPEVLPTGRIDFSNVELLDIPPYLRLSNVYQYPAPYLISNQYYINNFSLNNTRGSFKSGESIIRKYTLTDYDNNITIINAKISVYDDAIPIVDVSFVHTTFQIETSTSPNSNNLYNDISSILINNTINAENTPIVINRYDEIKFHFKMNKDCHCRIFFQGKDVDTLANGFNTSQTLTLHSRDSIKYTDASGVNLPIIFTIWDKNLNFYRFRYYITINDIPSFTFKIITDELESNNDKKQKLVLRINNKANTFKS